MISEQEPPSKVMEIHVELDGSQGDMRRVKAFHAVNHLTVESFREILDICENLRDTMKQLSLAKPELLTETTSGGICIFMHRDNLPDHEPEDEFDFDRCESTETGCDEWSLFEGCV